jgi:hypothetical protein
MIQKAKFSTRSFVVPWAVMALALSPAIALASGSMTPHAPSSDNFSRGKALYMERVACESCPAAHGASNADEARALIARLDDDEFKLSARQQRAVRSYLSRRFGIEG